MRGRWWKLMGLAGVAGVATTGAVIARAQRRRRAYTPDEIRRRLHVRLTEASATTPAPGDPPGTAGHSGTEDQTRRTPRAGWRARLPRPRRRR